MTNLRVYTRALFHSHHGKALRPMSENPTGCHQGGSEGNVGSMNLLCSVLLGFFVIALSGCDMGRVDRLERENAALKAKVDKADVARDFDLQAKCSKDARAWFNGNWSRDKDTILLDFSNHYNAKQNKCFILVEFHYTSHFAGPGGNSWTNDMSLTDVYENAKYAYFAENDITNFKPEINTRQEVISCDVAGAKCKTGDEFNNLIRPYMND